MSESNSVSERHNKMSQSDPFLINPRKLLLTFRSNGDVLEVKSVDFS